MRVVLFAFVIALIVAAACATTPKKHHKHLIVPTEAEATAPADAGPTDAHFAEVRKAAAAQLDCPEDKINIVCLRRDSEGECIFIRADGCDKSFEYQFGDTGT